MRITPEALLICLVVVWPCAGSGAAADLRLVEAVQNQRTDLVRVLLKQRVPANAPQADGATALHWAVHWDDLDMVDMLIRAGADPDAANELGVTPLSLACANGNASIVSRLLAAGANPNATAATGESALMTAVRTNNTDILSALLARGADVNARERARGQTALMWAVAEQHPEIVRLLVEHGADVHARSRTVHEFVIRSRTGAKRQAVESIERGGSTPLLFAVRVGSVDCARILVNAGADVNDIAPDGTSALLMATYSGHEALAAFLLDQGADPNRGGAGYTALHIAVSMGDPTLVKALMGHGANPNARLTKGTPATRFGAELLLPDSMAGATPFLLAAKFADANMMRILLSGGGDPQFSMKDGTTLLMAAVDPDRPVLAARGAPNLKIEKLALEAVTIALDLGADVNVTNQAGVTALQLAESRGFTTIVQLLAAKGARPKTMNKSPERRG